MYFSQMKKVQMFTKLHLITKGFELIPLVSSTSKCDFQLRLKMFRWIIRGRRDRYATKFWKFGYRWVPGKFEKLGTEGYRVPARKKFLGTDRYPGPARKEILGTDGYRVPARKKFWVPMGTGQKKKFGYRWVPDNRKIFTYADPWNNKK